MGASDLVQVLGKIAPFRHPWVDSDVGPMEDAALLRPPSGSPLAFTVDFITPIVDEPEAYGAIAAANALSDVYAMGGDPQAALAVCGFPEDKVGHEVLERIFRGGRDKAAEARCAIAGGHTVIDPELKYGLCVIGSVDPERALTQTGARPGDHLILTKPLGIGVSSQAIKKRELDPADLAHVVAVMSHLNRGAKDAALECGATAATDVTGFGLLGHLHHLLLGSGVSARIAMSRVPILPFARALVGRGLVPGGSRRNADYAAPHVRFAPEVSEGDQLLLADAQTSGGLLLSVPAENAPRLVAALSRHETHAQADIGEVVAGSAGHVEVLP